MQIQSFEIEHGGGLREVEFAGLIERWRAGGGPYWIDVTSSEGVEQAGLLSDLGFTQEVIDELLQPGHAARVLPLDDAVFFELPARMAGDPPELKSYAFLSADRIVLTLREALGDDGAASLEDLVGRLTLNGQSISELVCNLLLELSVDLRNRSSKLRIRNITLSRRMDDDPESVTLEDLLDLKREIVDLEAATDERIAVMETLEPLKHRALEPGRFIESFRVALGNTTSTARRLDRLSRRAADLQLRYEAHLQEKTNRRLGRLTIISAVFLPLTLIAGIYGMNFDVMPELHLRYAYPIALAGMVLVALGMVWWFRSRGWMD